jgi:STIP1 homology and U-box containing protein 1
VDCQACLGLGSESMKAYYYLAQAQIALHDFDEALKNALKAHEICVSAGDKSLSAITALVLRCKKERWDVMEKRRIRENQSLEDEMLELMEKERENNLETAQGEIDKKEIDIEWKNKMDELKRIFEKARAADSKRREVPDWVVDDISFGIMVDPVIVSAESPPPLVGLFFFSLFFFFLLFLLYQPVLIQYFLPSFSRPRQASPMSGRLLWSTFVVTPAIL